MRLQVRLLDEASDRGSSLRQDGMIPVSVNMPISASPEGPAECLGQEGWYPKQGERRSPSHGHGDRGVLMGHLEARAAAGAGTLLNVGDAGHACPPV